MMKKFNNNDFQITVYGSIEQPMFKAREIAMLLGYNYPANAIQDHVEKEDKFIVKDLLKKSCGKSVHIPKMHPKTILINESGLYSLILASKLPKAKEFKHWVTSEVLPSIRISGQYMYQDVKPKIIFNCQTESDLQKAVVNYIRCKYPKVYFTASLGELQDTKDKRIKSYQMGYKKGSPDLLIFYRNRKFNGLAIEFKTPQGTGKLSDEQNKVLKALYDQKWDVLASNDLFEITEKICCHMNQNKIPIKRQKIIKPILKRATILDYVNEDDDLEEFNLEGLIDSLEDDGEYDLADGIASHF
jgi:anti-repressor protein